MHYHGEIYFKEKPKDVVKAVSKVMKPFRERIDEETDEYVGFWDWWVIGGRWSGIHTETKLDPVKLNEFYRVCNEKGLFLYGRENQIDVQEARRTEEFLKLFPDFEGPVPTCRDPYKLDGYPDDIMPVEEVTSRLSCHTLILPGKVLRLGTRDEDWFREADFDGYVKKALEARGITTGYLVTVDYHC